MARHAEVSARAEEKRVAWQERHDDQARLDEDDGGDQARAEQAVLCEYGHESGVAREPMPKIQWVHG